MGAKPVCGYFLRCPLAKKKIDAEEYKVTKRDVDVVQRLKNYLDKLVGKEVEISSNIERSKGRTTRKIIIYNVGLQYNELGQVLTLENPSIPKDEFPQILVSQSMEITKEEKRIILKYPRQLQFRALAKPTLPDLEVYIQEVEK